MSLNRLPSPAAPPSTSSGGAKLKATVLSCYDIPNESQPSTVKLELLGAAVETGPPLARHRDKNSFKFWGGDGGAVNGSGDNSELEISAKLSQLYNSTATFRVEFSDQSQPDLIAQFHVSKRLLVNETKWLILNLRQENASSDASISTAQSPHHVQPTLRVKLHLTGPYRPEIASLMHLSSSWFQTVDKFSHHLEPLIKTLTVDFPSKLPATQYLLLPAFPLIALTAAALPAAMGVFVVGMPFFLPLLVAFLLGGILTCTMGTGLYFSTTTGRGKLGSVLQPVYTTFVATPTGQTMVYDVGDRPSPAKLAKFLLPQDIWAKLITCLVLDFIGSCSYLLPLVGEGFDVVWAPIFAVCIAGMFDEVAPNLKYVAFLEELLPLTDIIPSATMGWVREFGPGFLDQGKEQVHQLAVLARRERSALSSARG